MSFPFEVIALLLVVASLMGMLWAMFWPKSSARSPQSPQHWDLVYVDDDGVLLFTMVRVLELNMDSHRLTGWCSRTGAQRVFKLSKILKATDAQTGERVRLPSSNHLNPESLVDERGTPSAPALVSSPHKTAAHRRIEARDAEKAAHKAADKATDKTAQLAKAARAVKSAKSAKPSDKARKPASVSKQSRTGQHIGWA